MSNNYKSTLQSNNTSLQEILNTANQLQTGVSPDIYRSMLGGTITELRDDVVTKLRQTALAGCASLVSVDLPAATAIGFNSFQNCTSLASVNLPKLKIVSIALFHSCPSLVSITLPSVTTIQQQAFHGCSALTTVDLHVANSIVSSAFNLCTSLETFIVRSSKVCTLQSGVFSNTTFGTGVGYIYVPSTLVDSYKSATNWSVFADRIRAIEDHPHITGG